MCSPGLRPATYSLVCLSNSATGSQRPPSWLCCCCCCLCRAWSADEPAQFIALYGIGRSNQLYLLIYMALVLLFIGLLLTRDTVFSAWSVRASTRLHNRELFLGSGRVRCSWGWLVKRPA